MKEIYGDLLKIAVTPDEHGKLPFDLIIHGCNCRGLMGAGIARQIADKWSHVAEEDRHAYQKSKNLSTHQYMKSMDLDRVEAGCYTKSLITEAAGEFWVINAYTQIWPGPPNGIEFKESRLDYIREALKRVAKNFEGKRVGLPLIGAGLAGGDWDQISKVISEELDSYMDVTIVHYKP